MILGCIADDFTGASDAASFLAAGGLKTLLVNGVPSGKLPREAQAVVVALKSRTQPREEAVDDSLAAISYLKEQGAEHFYIKYCSTFDSTAEGNIGPVCDAAMDFLDVPCTLLCPSLPVNGRTVKDGILYVNGVPLAESHMKNHPLTPMRESNIVKLMTAQSRYESKILDWEQLAKGKLLAEKQDTRYYIPDYENEADGERIIAACGEMKLLTGGSGLLYPWAKKLGGGASTARRLPKSVGKSVLLAGSCSKMTLAQIKYFKDRGGLVFKLDPEKLISGEMTLEQVKDFLRKAGEKTVLVYSSETPGYLESIRGEKLEKYSRVLEEALAGTAKAAEDMGIRHIITAGGETSGAVTKTLGYPAYWIGPSVAPGVPVMMPTGNEELRLVLKSGNFGQEDFFAKAVKAAAGEEAVS